LVVISEPMSSPQFTQLLRQFDLVSAVHGIGTRSGTQYQSRSAEFYRPQPSLRFSHSGASCRARFSLMSFSTSSGREPSVGAKLCELDDKAFGPDFL
jgi:hypothetical protein